MERRRLLALVAAAALVPLTAAIGRVLLTLSSDPGAAVPAYVVRFCQRQLCRRGEGLSGPGLLDPIVPDVAVFAAFAVALAGCWVAASTRRSAWVTLPAAIAHAALAIVLWNPVVFLSFEGAWWGQLVVVAIFVTVLTAVRLLARGALPARRTATE